MNLQTQFKFQFSEGVLLEIWLCFLKCVWKNTFLYKAKATLKNNEMDYLKVKDILLSQSI